MKQRIMLFVTVCTMLGLSTFTWAAHYEDYHYDSAAGSDSGSAASGYGTYGAGPHAHAYTYAETDCTGGAFSFSASANASASCTKGKKWVRDPGDCENQTPEEKTALLSASGTCSAHSHTLCYLIPAESASASASSSIAGAGGNASASVSSNSQYTYPLTDDDSQNGSLSVSVNVTYTDDVNVTGVANAQSSASYFIGHLSYGEAQGDVTVSVS